MEQKRGRGKEMRIKNEADNKTKQKDARRGKWKIFF